VLIEIIGKTATSGAVVVSSRRQGLLPFRAGCGTTTVLAKVPSVGPLVELRVTLDGSGIFPGWHLKCDTCIDATGRRLAQPETLLYSRLSMAVSGSGKLSTCTATPGATACNILGHMHRQRLRVNFSTIFLVHIAALQRIATCYTQRLS